VINMSQTNYSNKIEKVSLVVAELMPKHPYHNYPHALDVYSVADMYAYLEGLENEDRFMLKTGALLHDVVNEIGAKDNEEKSAEFAEYYLPKIGYNARQIKVVSGLILATKLPTKPESLMEKIICDADVDNLGRGDFFEKSELVREELEIESREKWYQGTLKFLEMHQYYTESARRMRDKTKEYNIQKVKEMLQNGIYTF
jgi:predicted metal-dependent HD superfamily phosphohydrolase